MSLSDDNPELAGYEPTGDRPLRGRRMRVITRVVVVLGLLALVLPGIMTTVSVGSNTAQASCAIWVAYEEPGATGASATFEFFGKGGIGWECYSVGAFGGDRHVASLGLIPGTPKLPSRSETGA